MQAKSVVYVKNLVEEVKPQVRSREQKKVQLGQWAEFHNLLPALLYE